MHYLSFPFKLSNILILLIPVVIDGLLSVIPLRKIFPDEESFQLFYAMEVSCIILSFVFEIWFMCILFF